MATYPIIVCMWLHTGHPKQPFALKGRTNPALLSRVLSKTFAIKSCTNPAQHIFPWLLGEVVALHKGVLTKSFSMSVLYLKPELNWGNQIKSREADKIFTTAC